MDMCCLSCPGKKKHQPSCNDFPRSQSAGWRRRNVFDALPLIDHNILFVRWSCLFYPGLHRLGWIFLPILCCLGMFKKIKHDVASGKNHALTPPPMRNWICQNHLCGHTYIVYDVTRHITIGEIWWKKYERNGSYNIYIWVRCDPVTTVCVCAMFVLFKIQIVNVISTVAQPYCIIVYLSDAKFKNWI